MSAPNPAAKKPGQGNADAPAFDLIAMLLAMGDGVAPGFAPIAPDQTTQGQLAPGQHAMAGTFLPAGADGVPAALSLTGNALTADIAAGSTPLSTGAPATPMQLDGAAQFQAGASAAVPTNPAPPPASSAISPTDGAGSAAAIADAERAAFMASQANIAGTTPGLAESGPRLAAQTPGGTPGPDVPMPGASLTAPTLSPQERLALAELARQPGMGGTPGANGQLAPSAERHSGALSSHPGGQSASNGQGQGQGQGKGDGGGQSSAQLLTKAAQQLQAAAPSSNMGALAAMQFQPVESPASDATARPLPDAPLGAALAATTDQIMAPRTEASLAYHARASATPPAYMQVALQISRAMDDGNDRLTIDLKPAALGRISVQLDITDLGRVAATITADRPETLDLLQRDARALERALGDAGLKADSGSLQFNLRGDGQQAGNGKGGTFFNGVDGPIGNGAADEDTHGAARTDPHAVPHWIAEGRIDIHI